MLADRVVLEVGKGGFVPKADFDIDHPCMVRAMETDYKFYEKYCVLFLAV